MSPYKNLGLLTLAQGAFFTNNVVFISINGLVGLALAPVPWMATLPITAYVLGSTFFTQVVSRTQRAWGRKRSFQFGLLTGFCTALMCAFMVQMQWFWGLVASTAMAGFYSANAQLYRFAAPELVAPSLREKAISWVMAGGLIGAVVGPNLASWTRTASIGGMQLGNFVASYLALSLVALIGLTIVSNVQFVPLASSTAAKGRSARELAKNPRFVLAILCGALGYGVMNLLMASTPIAMQQCGLGFGFAADVLMWHVIGMFLPSFFTGSLIKRFGVDKILWAGVLLNLLCVGFALSGIAFHNFLVALTLLGVGWNFLYVGGTALLTQCYEPHERTQAQAAMDMWVFVTMAVTSFASGALVSTQGWMVLNVGSLVPLALCAAGLMWIRINTKVKQIK